MSEAAEHRISVHLDELLQRKGMTLVDLSSRVGVTVANLSILKNGHGRAIRFSTLTAICDISQRPAEATDRAGPGTGKATCSSVVG
jgi:putative transcriptional regulator